MCSLLDVNVLIALISWNHQFHELARTWLKNQRQFGWATSPITQNGTACILADPRYQKAAGFTETIYPNQVIGWLRQMVASADHRFVEDSVSLLDDGILTKDAALANSKVTDLYLLALAVHNNMRFVTFDQHISIQQVRNAHDGSLVLIGNGD